MIAIAIHGLQDGYHKVDLSVPVDEVENIFPEFTGNVTVKGEVQKLGNKYTLKAKVACNAKLICDRSLTEYIEPIEAELTTSYVADNDLFHVDAETSDSEKAYEIRAIREDDREIDITEEVRQELAVNLPLKRVAPQFRDKDIEEIFPQVAKEKKKSKDEIDERWAALKNIKFDTNN